MFAVVTQVTTAGDPAEPEAQRLAELAGGEAAATVELQAGGSSDCGTLAQAQQGAVAVVTSGRQVTVPIDQLTALGPADGC
jgi:hypothetical protein